MPSKYQLPCLMGGLKHRTFKFPVQDTHEYLTTFEILFLFYYYRTSFFSLPALLVASLELVKMLAATECFLIEFQVSKLFSKADGTTY